MHHGWKQGRGGGGEGRGRAGPGADVSGDISAAVRDLVVVHGMTMREAAEREPGPSEEGAAHRFFSLKLLRVHSCSARWQHDGGRPPRPSDSQRPLALTLPSTTRPLDPSASRQRSSERHCEGSKIHRFTWLFTVKYYTTHGRQAALWEVQRCQLPWRRLLSTG